VSRRWKDQHLPRKYFLEKYFSPSFKISLALKINNIASMLWETKVATDQTW
jgi:hypothetical protein